MKLLKSLSRDTAGNVAITTALTLPLAIFAMALGVDYGHLTLQQRQLQSTADLAAIAAAASPTDPEKAALGYFQLNNQNFAVRTATGLLTPQGEVAFSPEEAFATYDGYAEIKRGHYSPDLSKAVAERFQPNVMPYDAVRVTMHKKGEIFFAGSFATAPILGANGTAASDKLAAFSIGSRLASLNEGILNALLGKLIGTTISLKAMDYRALADLQVNAFKTLDALALDLGLQAGSYSDLLKTDITYGKFLNALGKTTGVTPTVSALLKTLETAANKSKVTLKLQDVLALGPLSERLIGQSDNLAVNASVFELINAAAVAGNGSNQVAIDLGSNIAGLGSVTLTIAIGEPPVGTPSLAVGAPGSIVRTAQTRIALEATVDGLSAIAGLKVRIPLYIEVAYAEAQLSGITCTNGAPTVNIDAIPGVAEIALGDVDKSAFANFGKDPRVTRTDIVSALLLKVNGMANATATNMSVSKLSFASSEIASGKVKSISTKDTLTSLTTSLLGNLDLRIELLSLPLVLPKAVLASLADTLKIATEPLDTVLYNTLLLVGVRIGEADVRVTGATCRNPVLVQ